MGIFYGSINHTTSGRKKRSNGSKKRKTVFRPCTTVAKQQTYADIRMEEAKQYKSRDEANGVAARVPRQEYTGTLVKGIGTMHKSNAIPIINEEQMKDLARMRR